MRPISGVLASLLAILAAATAGAQEGGIINKGGIGNQDNQVYRSILEQMNPLVSHDPPPFTIEGLPKGDRNETLTWRRAYELALVRSRDPGKPPATTLDPKALDEQSSRLGVADFARFRREFLDRAEGGFRDPSARYYGLLGRSRAVENAIVKLATLENLSTLVQELVRGESSGLTQMHVDMVNEPVQRARLDLIGRQMRYRDALDEMKVELGLSPQAPVVLDRAPLAKFASTFEDVIRWSASPSREFEKLDELARGLPGCGDFVVSGRSLLEAALANPGQLEEFVTASGRLAIANRGIADASRELDVRKRTRKLAELAVAYLIEQRHFVLIMRGRSMAQEQVFAPPQPRMTDAGFVLEKLVDLQDRLGESDDRLVEIWTSYHALRLALYRELDLLPVGDWKGFYDKVLGGKDDPGPAKAVPPPAVEPPPAQPGHPVPPPIRRPTPPR